MSSIGQTKRGTMTQEYEYFVKLDRETTARLGVAEMSSDSRDLLIWAMGYDEIPINHVYEVLIRPKVLP